MTKSVSRAAAAAAVLILASTSASAALYDLDVGGIASWDEQSDPDNVVLTIDLAAALGAASGTAVTIDGIGWDVVIESVGQSWLSEVTVAIENSDASEGVFITPGGADQGPGPATAYDSGGIVLLADAGIPDIHLFNGIMRLEFFDEFDDIADTIDAHWVSGTLTVQATVVPIPAALPLLMSALGFGALAGRRRRAA